MIWRQQHIDRLTAACESMDKHPELANTHKYYDMTKAEAQKHWMKKINFAFKHYRDEWFTSYQTGQALWLNL